jgi:hypothetical protein
MPARKALGFKPATYAQLAYVADRARGKGSFINQFEKLHEKIFPG